MTTHFGVVLELREKNVCSSFCIPKTLRERTHHVLANVLLPKPTPKFLSEISLLLILFELVLSEDSMFIVESGFGIKYLNLLAG